jgi:hypothetical protein
MGRGEISWVRRNEEGEKLQIYAHREGDRWNFYARLRRYDQWEPLEQPPLEDWVELLDGVRRRAQRRLLRPEEVPRVERMIRERFPEWEGCGGSGGGA